MHFNEDFDDDCLVLGLMCAYMFRTEQDEEEFNRISVDWASYHELKRRASEYVGNLTFKQKKIWAQEM